MDLKEVYEKESRLAELTEVEEDFYERAQRHVAQLREGRDQIDDEYSEEAQRADSKLSNAKLYLDRIRAARQQKINRAVFTPGKPPRKVVRNLTCSEEEYVDALIQADKELRSVSIGEGLGEPVSKEEENEQEVSL